MTVLTEHEEQKELIKWVRAHKHLYPDLDMIYAVPNGAHLKGGYLAAAKLIREGLQKGVPDLCLPVPKGSYHGLFIEMKRIKGSSVSNEQKMYINRLKMLGYKAVVCKGWITAKDVIIQYYSLGDFYLGEF